MNKKVFLSEILSGGGGASEDALSSFAIFNLGLVEMLLNGGLDAESAVRFFYHADDCLYVKKNIKNKAAQTLMGHGVQLPDFFDALPIEQAQRGFLRKLSSMRELCLRMVDEGRSFAWSPWRPDASGGDGPDGSSERGGSGRA